MKPIIASIVGLLCLGCAALAEGPIVTATVAASADCVTYNYTLANSTSDDIWQFAVFMPGKAARTITSSSTSEDGWSVLVREAAFDMICWDWHGNGVIGSGCSADFTFTTVAGIPTTNSYTTPGSDSNWGYAYGVPGGGTVGVGNSVLPVPVPEPGSLLSLAAGLTPFMLRRRR